MSNRITQKDLEAVIARINRITKSPETPHAKTPEGKYISNVGNYHLSMAYGGYNLQRITNECGGTTCPLGTGHVTKKELYNLMHAFIRGLDAGKE